MPRRRLRLASRILLAFALLSAALPAVAFGRLVDGTTPVLPGTPLAITLSQPTSAVPPDGHLRMKVTVSLPQALPYAEVRLRLKRPDGRLVYQKTEVRQNLPAGENSIEYDHDLAPLTLPQGRYPIEVRVVATDTKATTAVSRLLVIDPAAERVPVAVVVTGRDVPSYGVDGRVVRDPAEAGSLREQLGFVASLVQDRAVPLSLAVPPLLLEEGARTAAGYETTAGVAVKATDPSALRSARLVGALQSAVATGTLGLIDVPYALPDAALLNATGASEDLSLHWAQTDSVYASVLRAPIGPRVAYLGRTLTRGALASLADRAPMCVLAHGESLRSGDTTAVPGIYTLPDTNVHALVVDDAASVGASMGAEAFYDALFAHLETGSPAVVLLDLGREGANDPVDVQHALDWIESADWLHLTTTEALATSPAGGAATLSPADTTEAPEAYRSELKGARDAIVGYAQAAGAMDADAVAVTRSLLVAQSGMWAGHDGLWSSAPEAEAFAESARQFVLAQYALIKLDTKDVTLSGTKGNVPLTLINDTGKHLDLTLVAHSSAGTVVTPTQAISVQPTQNLLTIPVDLGNTLSDSINVRITAGDALITETTVTVRASYLDRLGIVAIVVLVLAGLLFYIRKRVKTVDAGTITSGDNGPDGSEESTS